MGGALAHAWSQAGVTLTDQLSMATVVVLTVPDDAIAAVASSLAGAVDDRAVVLHCAGALDSSVLRSSGATAVGSLHPAQTVTGRSPEADAQALQGAWAAIEGDPGAVREANELARAAGMRPIPVTADAKPLWHAAAVLACNDLVALLHLADRLLVDAAGVRQGIEVFLPLVRQTLDNVERQGLSAALTGPVARGDQGTIARHLQALAPYPDAKAAYEVLAKAARDLASSQGSEDPP